MATKPRTSTSQGRPVYEDFQPNSEMTESLEDHSLHIYLPGFTREQIRITFVNLTRMVNVSGERPSDIGTNRWSRLNQSYPVPPSCEVEKLEAKFGQGTLTIIMPKKLFSQQPTKKAPDGGPFPPKQEEPKPDKKAQQDFPPKPTTTSVEEPKPKRAQDEIPQKYPPSRVEEPKPEKAQERIPQKHTPARLEEPEPEKDQEKIPQRYRPAARVEEAKPEKAQEKIPQEYTATRLEEARDKKTASPQKVEEEASARRAMERQKMPALIPPVLMTESRPPQKGQDEIESRKPRVEMPEKGPSEVEEKPTFKMAPRKPEKTLIEKELRTRKEAPKTPQMEKEETTSKEDITGMIGKGIKQVSASASQVVSRISERKWNEEDKPMLVNMGAAVLVIAALGAYVSYRFASSGTA